MIRKAFLNIFFLGLIFSGLGNIGITFNEWEFWSILFGVIGLFVNDTL